MRERFPSPNQETTPKAESARMLRNNRRHGVGRDFRGLLVQSPAQACVCACVRARAQTNGWDGEKDGTGRAVGDAGGGNLPGARAQAPLPDPAGLRRPRSPSPELPQLRPPVLALRRPRSRRRPLKTRLAEPEDPTPGRAIEEVAGLLKQGKPNAPPSPGLAPFPQRAGRDGHPTGGCPAPSVLLRALPTHPTRFLPLSKTWRARRASPASLAQMEGAGSEAPVSARRLEASWARVGNQARTIALRWRRL